MNRQAVTSLQTALFKKIRANHPGRQIFTTYAPEGTVPPTIELLNVQVVIGDTQSIELECQKITMDFDVWSKSGENTEAFELIDECCTAILASLDLTADDFLLVDATVLQFGVKTEPYADGPYQHGTVRASFEVEDTA